MPRTPARRLLGAVCGALAVACVTMVVPVAVAEPGWTTGPERAASPAAVGPTAAPTVGHPAVSSSG